MNFSRESPVRDLSYPRDFPKLLKAKTGLFLISGPNEPGVIECRDRLGSALRDRYRDLERQTVDLGDAGVSGAIEALATDSLFAAPRLVVLERIGALKDAELTRLAPYLAEFAGVGASLSNFALMTGGVVRPRETFRSFLDVHATRIVAWELRAEELDGWIAGRFKERGCKVDPDVSAYLREIFGTDQGRLSREIEKIAEYARAADTRSVDTRGVEIDLALAQTVTPPPDLLGDSEVEDLVLAVLSRDPRSAFGIARRILLETEDPHVQIAARLGRIARLLLAVNLTATDPRYQAVRKLAREMRGRRLIPNATLQEIEERMAAIPGASDLFGQVRREFLPIGKATPPRMLVAALNAGDRWDARAIGRLVDGVLRYTRLSRVAPVPVKTAELDAVLAGLVPRS